MPKRKGRAFGSEIRSVGAIRFAWLLRSRLARLCSSGPDSSTSCPAKSPPSPQSTESGAKSPTEIRPSVSADLLRAPRPEYGQRRRRDDAHTEPPLSELGRWQPVPHVSINTIDFSYSPIFHKCAATKDGLPRLTTTDCFRSTFSFRIKRQTFKLALSRTGTNFPAVATLSKAARSGVRISLEPCPAINSALCNLARNNAFVIELLSLSPNAATRATLCGRGFPISDHNTAPRLLFPIQTIAFCR